MAVSVSSIISSSQTTSGTSATTGSVTPTANKLQLLAVMSRTNASVEPNQPTASGNSLTWVAIGSAYYDDTSTSRKKVTLLRALGESPTAGSITIDFAGQSQTDIIWILNEVSAMDTSGTNGSGAIVQSTTNLADDAVAPSSLTVTLSAFNSTSNATFGAFANGTETGTFTAGSGFSIVTDQAAGSTNGRLATEFKNTNDTTVDMSQSGATAAMGGVAIEIRAESILKRSTVVSQAINRANTY